MSDTMIVRIINNIYNIDKTNKLILPHKNFTNLPIYQLRLAIYVTYEY